MGLRGKKPAKFRPHQKEVWKAYLLLKSLGYWSDVAGRGNTLKEAVAQYSKISREKIRDILGNTSPVGVFDNV